MRERLATLISGGGTTMQAIIGACKTKEVPMDVACVIASTPTAGGIKKAEEAGISKKDIVVVDPLTFRGGDGKVDQDAFGSAILKELRTRGVTVVTQNGWMPLTPQVVIDEYRETIFNQHPGPVPEFGGEGMYGRRVHATRLLFTRQTKRDPWTEAIAQRVHRNFDKGAIVKVSRIDILPDDTVDDLQKRVLPIEHNVQIALLQDVARGNVRELPRLEKLVRPGEERVLFEAKQVSRLLYPHG